MSVGSVAVPLYFLEQETVQSDAYRNALSVVLKTWQSPYALADYYVMQRKEREASKT